MKKLKILFENIKQTIKEYMKIYIHQLILYFKFFKNIYRKRLAII
jgi:hypothetical protein